MSDPPRKLLTLVLIINKEKKEVLLGMKKRGFGKGRWNGFGGKVKKGETTEECAKRETQEECGLNMTSFYKVGHMEFVFVGDPVLLDVSVFRCDASYTGTVTESEEMIPKWFSFDDVPYEQMWPDDYLWYPHMFNDIKFKAKFLFKGHNEILEQSIETVDKL